MMSATIEAIEMAVKKLPPSDLAEFDSSQWDAQVEADAASGKLDALAEEALTEYCGGKAREL